MLENLPDNPAIDAPNALAAIAVNAGFGAQSVYLIPAPLYHAAPLRRCAAAPLRLMHGAARRCRASKFCATRRGNCINDCCALPIGQRRQMRTDWTAHDP